MTFGGAGLAYASGRDGNLLVSTDDGATWSVAETGVARYRSSAARGSSAWHVGDGAVIRATTDGGATWFDQNAGTASDLRGVHFVSTAEGWIAGSNSTLLYTSDAGATWTPRNTGITGGLNGVFFVDSARGWAVGDLGAVFVTGNGGLSWLPETSGTAQSLNDVFFVSAALGWAVGDQGTLIVRSDPTGVEERAAILEPRIASSPNPFAASTSIRYTLPGSQGARTMLTVHDVTGRNVRTLFDGSQAPGTHSVTWDGRADTGSRLANGMYFYRLSWRGQTHTGRAVMIQ